MKRNQGITLIALVVTIVVLLILAAISIGVLTGENGIIDNAKKSKEDTEIAEEKEILNVSVAQAVGKDIYGKLEEDNLQERLNENAEGCELEKIGDNYKVTFPSEREYIVNGDGDINRIDRENKVNLVAKLAYDNYTGEYIIGVGFEKYQTFFDVIMEIITENGVEKIVINEVNKWKGTNFTTLEEVFKYLYEMGYTNKLCTSLEEYADESGFSSVQEMMSYILSEDKEIIYKYLIENKIEGTLIAPNEEEYRLSTENIFNEYGGFFGQYCYEYIINENGEYTFIFYGDDGSFGEITLIINNENPQIVSSYDGEWYENSLMLMLGIDNFIDMQEASFENFGLYNTNETIDLTPYISNHVYGFPDDINGINFSSIYNGGHYRREGYLYI